MSSEGGSTTHPLELLAAAALVLLAVVGLALWCVGGLAGFVFGEGWPRVGVSELLSVAARLPDHAGDPRKAWPETARAGLPGPVGMYAATMLFLAGSAALVSAGVAVRGRIKPPGSSSKWARGRDLTPLLVSKPQPGRVTLGRFGSHLIAVEQGHSSLVIAPTQTGKTTGLAIPAILEWQGPVLSTSVKTDLLRDTLAARSAVGRVQLFDPGDSTGLPGASWTPLADCADWGGARRMASWLAEGAAPAKKGLSDGDFWYTAAAKLLAPVLFAAGTSGRTMADVVAWIDSQEEAEILDALEATGSVEALTSMQATWIRDERQRSSVYTTAETILEAYADPGVLEHSRFAEIAPTDLLDGGANTLYLSATVREQRRLRPVFVALIEGVIEEAYRRSARSGAALDPPLLIVLDEAANIAPLPDLDVIAATGAGHGVQLVTVLQDLAQAHDRWGRDRADTIVNNHRAKVIGAGVSDERTLDYLARLLGDTEVRQHSSTSGEHGRRSVTESTTYRPLAPAQVVRQGKPGSAVLVYGGLAPAWIHLRPWYADPGLRRLVGKQRSAATYEAPDLAI